MDVTHFHLTFNHFPIIGSIFGIVFLVIGFFKKYQPFLISGLVIFVAISIITIPVFYSGEGAEEVVEKLGVEHDFIHEHEEAGELSYYLMCALGLASLAYLIFLRKEQYRWAAGVILVLALVVFGSMVRTGYLGGLIRHTEIRKNSKNKTEKKPVEINESEEEE